MQQKALNNPGTTEKAVTPHQIIVPADLANLTERIQQGEEIWITKPHENSTKKYKLIFRNGSLQYEWKQGGGIHRKIFDPFQENYAITTPPGTPESQNETTGSPASTIREETSNNTEKTINLFPINGSHIILLNEVGKRNPTNPPVFYIQYGVNGTLYPLVIDGNGQVFYKDGPSLKCVDTSSRENWYLPPESFKLLEKFEEEIVREKREWLDKNRIKSNYTPEREKKNKISSKEQKAFIKKLVEDEYSTLETVSELFEEEQYDIKLPSKEKLLAFLKIRLTPEQIWFIQNELTEPKIICAPITTSTRFTEACNHPNVSQNIQDMMNILTDSRCEDEMKNEIRKTGYIRDNRIVAWDITIVGNEAHQRCPSWDFADDSLQTRLNHFEKHFPKSMGVTGMTYFSYLTMLLDAAYIEEDVPDYVFTRTGNNQCYGTFLNGSINPNNSKELPIAEANDMGPRPLYWISLRERKSIMEHMNFRPCVCLRYR